MTLSTRISHSLASACRTSVAMTNGLMYANKQMAQRFPGIKATFATSGDQSPRILLEDKHAGFGFIRHNERPPKPRMTGVTEIRGPYYSAMGKRYLEDVLETQVLSY